MLTMSFAKRLRLRRLHRHEQGRLLVVPLDHSITDGPVTGGRKVNRLVGQIAGGGADAVVLHKGALTYVDPAWFQSMNLFVHLSASTVHAADPDDKYLVAGVDEALRFGADGVSVHVNLGSNSERQQIRDLASASAEAHALGIPLMAMVYARGPRVEDPHDPTLLAHGAVLAADLGADVVKTTYPGDPVSMAQIVDACPVEVIVAGGPAKGGAALEDHVVGALRGGASGIACGRAVFSADDPRQVVTDLSALIHQRPVVERAALARAVG